jgi:hypothetical protein
MRALFSLERNGIHRFADNSHGNSRHHTYLYTLDSLVQGVMSVAVIREADTTV